MKRVGILGSTGSIGTQSLDLIDKNPDRFRVSVLTCASRVDLLEQQIEKYHPQIAVTAKEEDARTLSAKFPKTEFFWGEKGLKSAAAADCSDIVLNALMGISGLGPTMAAIASGKDIALANKET